MLDYLTRSLANEPDAVVVEADAPAGLVRFRLHVAPEDMGRVIGRRGRDGPGASARWSGWPAPATGSRPTSTSSTTDDPRRSARGAGADAGPDRLDAGAGTTAALLDVGRVVRPHGLRGEVVVELWTNRPERIDAGPGARHRRAAS